MTDAASPVATVVIPTFNAAATIDLQLACLAEQDADFAWEVVVADNGSSDDTRERASAWADRLRIRVIDASARRGPAAARNIGASHAASPLLLFCDADDAAEPDWVAALTTALRSADAAAGSRRYDRLNASPHGPSDWPEPFYRKEPLAHLDAASSHNLGVRTDVFRALGGFDEVLSAGEDVDLCWRLQLGGYRLAAAPEAVMQIRRRTGVVATFRQAFAYGRADRLLATKFAHVRREHPAGGDALVPEREDAGAGAGADQPRRSLVRRLRSRGLRAPDPVYVAERWGRRLGRRFGRIDPVLAAYTGGA